MSSAVALTVCNASAGDGGVEQIKGFQQGAGGGRLGGLGAVGRGLGDDDGGEIRAGRAGQGGHQMQLFTVGVDGAADGLTVQASLCRSIGAGRGRVRGGGPLGGGPLGDHRVQDVGVGVGADPPQGGA